MEKRKKTGWWWWLVLGVLCAFMGFRDWLAPGFPSLYNPRFARLTPWALIVVEWLLGAAFIIAATRKAPRRQP